MRSGRSGIYTPEEGEDLIFMVLRFPEGEGIGTEPRLPFGEIEDASQLPESTTGSLLIFGKVMDEAITEIQITDSQKGVRTEPVHQTMFAVLLEEGNLPCQLRAANENGVFLEEYSLMELAEWQAPSQLSQQVNQACNVSND